MPTSRTMPVPAAAGKVAAGKVAAVERINAVRQGIERRLRRHVNGLEGAGGGRHSRASAIRFRTASHCATDRAARHGSGASTTDSPP